MIYLWFMNYIFFLLDYSIFLINCFMQYTGGFSRTKRHLGIFKITKFSHFPLSKPSPGDVHTISCVETLFYCWWTCVYSMHFSFNTGAGFHTWNIKINLHCQVSLEGIWGCSNLRNFPCLEGGQPPSPPHTFGVTGKDHQPAS